MQTTDFAPRSATPDFLAGGGKTGALMRSLNWSASPLGAPEMWPLSLRTVVALLLSSQFPMFVAWGEELGFLYNDAYAEILGAKHPQALGARFFDVWSEIWSDISPLIDAAMAGEATYRENLPLVVNRKGFDEQAWFTFSYSPVRDESGRVAGMFCAVAETTQTVLAEHAVRESEARLRLALEGAKLGTWDWDLRTLRGSWSPRTMEILGVDNGEDVTAERRSETIHPDDRERVWRELAEAVQSGNELVSEYRVVRPDGEIRWVTSRGAVQRDDVGVPVRASGIVLDITDRAAAEAALRELNETLEQRVAEALAERKLLADLVEGTDAFVQVADLDFRWLAINKASADEFERIYGVRPKVGDSMLDLLADRPEHQAAVRAVWSRALAGEEFTEIGEFGDPGHERRFYEMKYNTLRDAEGRRIGAYQFVYDVTERLRDQRRLSEAEDGLRQSQKMEAVGQLVSGLAHDFNNLLGAVVGSLDLIRRRADDPERVRRFAEAGLQAAERGSKLTGQLLAFSRSQRIDLKPLLVCDVIEGVRDMLARTLGPMIELEFDLNPCPVPVLADATQVEMTILNLAINARDAMPDGGKLRIATAPRRIEADPELKPGDYVELTVSDTGIGMDEATLRRAMDPFFTTKPIGKGTGLGLAQVYGSARQSGGTVRLESKPGEGTAVRVLLPRTDRAPQEVTVTDGEVLAHLRPQATVLMVDDDPDLRGVLVNSLDALGYRVIEAADGATGLSALDRQRPDVMVVDFAMPGMNGAEVAKAARERWPDLPVVLTSGYADSDAINRAVGNGARILRKPFRIDELLGAVAEVLKDS